MNNQADSAAQEETYQEEIEAMQIVDVFMIREVDDIIEYSQEVDVDTYIADPGYYFAPKNGQNIGMLYDASFQWNFYADNTTGNYIGRAPYPGYAGVPNPPANATPVPSIPTDISHYSQQSDMSWDFINNIWIYSKITLKEKAYEALVSLKSDNSPITVSGKDMNTENGWVVYYLARLALAQNGPALSTRKILFNGGDEIAEMTNEDIVMQVDAYLEDLQRWDNALADVHALIDAEDSSSITVPDNLADYLNTAYNNL